MKIYTVTDREFAPYGRVVSGLDTADLLAALAATPLPDQGVEYLALEPSLQSLPVAKAFSSHLYGGMPVQMGWCNGYNTKLNCLEYHRDSEFNLGTGDFILLVALRSEMEQGRLDTACVKAFRVPAGTLVEVYATTLHYAPCHTDPAKGFRMLVALPAGTNTEKPDICPCTDEDGMLWGCNKWLLAHADAPEAAQGAYVGLVGENIDIASDIA